MVDFNKLLNEDASPAPLNPAEIFHSLPRSGTKFDYLRDVQGKVLEAWYARRTERDIVVKMNTGSGKTLVGLLMLQSLLNEQTGPVLYLCPFQELPTTSELLFRLSYCLSMDFAKTAPPG